MYSDLRERKILNIVTFPGMIIAIFINSWLNGQAGFIDSIIGISLGFVLLYIPYALRGVGAGDVKFLMMCGAFSGKNGIIIVFLAGSVLAAIFSIVKVLRNGGINGIFITGTSMLSKDFVNQNVNKLGRKNTVPYGIPYGIGAIIQFVMFNYLGKGIL